MSQFTSAPQTATAVLACLALLCVCTANLGRQLSRQLPSGAFWTQSDNSGGWGQPSTQVSARKPFVSGTPLSTPMSDEDMYAVMLREQQEADRLYFEAQAQAAKASQPPAPVPAAAPTVSQAVAPLDPDDGPVRERGHKRDRKDD